MEIEEGDSVFNRTTGETWFVLGVNRERDQMCMAGWPPAIFPLSDCKLAEKGTGITSTERSYRDRQFGSWWDTKDPIPVAQ